MKSRIALFVIAVIVSSVAAEPKCCAGPCKAPYEKYYSVDHIFNRCGECCMLPKDFWKYKIFEIGLTKAKTDTPCADTKSPFKNQGDYTVYESTVTHGTKLLNMTLDMYSPAKLTEELQDSHTPCCNGTCPEGMKKYYSVDHGFGHSPFCGETCLDPKKYKIYHLFEKNLTLATEHPDHPCMYQFDPVGGHYSVYNKTVTHGVPGLLAVTLDLWGEGL